MNQSNGTADTSRKKLELALEVPVTAKVLRDKPFKGENRFGKYHLWTLEVDGDETVFFPDKETNQTLLSAGLKAGDTICLARSAVQNGKKISSHIDVQVVSRGSNGKREEGDGAPGGASEDGYRELMERSLQDAIDATKSVNTVQWDVDSIRSIALSLFIQRVKMS